MDPSYNNSFGSFSSGGAGAIVSVPDSAPVIMGEKKSKKWVVILIDLLLLVGVGVGVFVLLSGDQSGNNVSENENIESSVVRIELQKLFKIDDELKKYDGSELARIYVEGDFEAARQEINTKLSELDQKSIEYVAQYVVETKKFVDGIEAAIEIYYTNGCQGDEVETIAKCELPEEAEKKYVEKINEAMSFYESVRYVVESARHYYENGGGNE